MSNHTTVVIFTHNRYPFLLRVLRFLKSYETPPEILILDSSSEDVSSEDLRKILNSKGIVWKKFDPKIFIAQKIAIGLREVKTPFSVLCADDDFIVPIALEKCVAFLKKNDNYSCALGLMTLHRFPFSWSPVYYDRIAAEALTPEERLKLYFSGKSCVPFYAVHRTEMLRLIWGETARYVSDWGLLELFPCALSLLYGKMRVFPDLYMSRECNTTSWYDADYQKRIYSVEKCEKAIKGITLHLESTTSRDVNRARQFVNSELTHYVERLNKNSVEKKSKFSFARIQQHFHYRLVRRKYSQMIANKNSKSFADFQRVEQSVLFAKLRNDSILNSRKEYRQS